MSNRNASIVAVGTEITSGQIKNAHAAWISSQIDDYGITTTHHVAIPDDQELMLEAFDYASQDCEFVFITGGLGPTSDDFTRNVIADWLDCELEFHDDIWQDLQLRLSSKSVKVSPSHKNQCYFPEGATILSNSVGTAHGFYFKYDNKHFWVLPGPSPELRAIWNDHVKKQLLQLTDGKKYVVKKWRCIGLPESEAADLVEDVLKGSSLQTGYRLDNPYVEVKVWLSDIKSQSKWIETLDTKLKPWVVCKDEEDLAQIFLDMTLKNAPLIVIDDSTKGEMSERLMARVRDSKYGFEFKSLFSTSADLNGISFDGHGTLVRILSTTDSLSWNVDVTHNGKNYFEKLTFKSTAKVNPERIGKIKTELTLKQIVDWLR